MSFTQEATLRRKLLSMQLSQGKEPLKKELSKSHQRCVTVQRGKSIYFMVGGQSTQRCASASRSEGCRRNTLMSLLIHHKEKPVSLRTEGSLRVRLAEKGVEKAALDYSDYIKSYSRKVARKRTSFLEQQKDRIVKKFHNQLTHRKQNMVALQYCLLQHSTALPRVAKQSRNPHPDNLSTACDTDPRHPQLMNPYFTTNQSDALATFNGTACFQQQQQQQSLPQEKAARYNSSVTKSSRRYEQQTEESLYGDPPSERQAFHESAHKLQLMRIEENQGKIRSICKAMRASRQSLATKENRSANYTSINFAIDTNESAAKQQNHQDSQREAEQEAKMSLEIAKMMIARKRDRFLQQSQMVIRY